MKITHPQQRASERYYIPNFNEKLAIKEVYEDRFVQVSESFEKYSRTFLIKYFNKYVLLVTDFEVRFVKTCLPFKNQFEYLNKLLVKINTCDKMVA